jgi:hypothetical protein
MHLFHIRDYDIFAYQVNLILCILLTENATVILSSKEIICFK